MAGTSSSLYWARAHRTHCRHLWQQGRGGTCCHIGGQQHDCRERLQPLRWHVCRGGGHARGDRHREAERGSGTNGAAHRRTASRHQ